MIPLAIPDLSGNESKYLQQCISTNFVSSVGPFVDQFENLISEMTNSVMTVATSSGTTALQLALKISGVGYNDLVIIPSFTFIATANAVSHCGAQLILADIDQGTWTINIEQVKDFLKKDCVKNNDGTYLNETNQRIAAIIPVYVLGNIAHMDELNSLSTEFNIPIVADGACAIGAKYKGNEIGHICELTALSFNGNKTITSGGGGAIIGTNKDKLKYAKHLSTTAKIGSNYDFDDIGYNYRMTNIQAAVGVAQLERLDKFVKRKQEIYNKYTEAFALNPLLQPFPNPNYCESSHWFSGIFLDCAEKAVKLVTYLNSEGIQAKSFWKPIHLQKPYSNCHRLKLDHSNKIWDKIVTLPSSTSITEEELNIIINKVNIFFK